jgi:hypothetical protein
VSVPGSVTAFWEVHCWPHRGLVLVIDKPLHRDVPELTWLTLEVDNQRRSDATVRTATALAAAVAFDVPEALCVQHDRHGTMLASPAGLGLPVLVLRRPR